MSNLQNDYVTNFSQYLDKNSINFASVYGLKSGTHLHGQQYSWLSRCTPSILIVDTY